jgi:hypothetical protein
LEQNLYAASTDDMRCTRAARGNCVEASVKLNNVAGPLALAILAGTTGCTAMIAGAVAVSTPDEIKRSEYVVRLDSSRSLQAVDACLKQALLLANNGSSPAHLTYRDVGAEPHQFLISNGVGSSLSGARPELLALVETAANAKEVL